MAILSNARHYSQLVVTWSLKMNITINLTKVNTHDNNWSMLQMNWTQNIIFDISQQLQIEFWYQCIFTNEKNHWIFTIILVDHGLYMHVLLNGCYNHPWIFCSNECFHDIPPPHPPIALFESALCKKQHFM